MEALDVPLKSTQKNQFRWIEKGEDMVIIVQESDFKMALLVHL